MSKEKLLGGKMMEGIQYGGKTYIHEPDVRNAVNAALATNEARNKRIEALEANLGELLRLYDWRFILAEAEKDPNYDQVELRRCLRQYGEEKKAAWVEARRLVGKTSPAIGLDSK